MEVLALIPFFTITSGQRVQRSAVTLESQLTLRPMEDRPRRDMVLHFTQLAKELRPYDNGASWEKYLALPKDLLNDEPAEGSSERARKLLKRFEKINSDPVYAQVTALPAFRPAHESLKLVFKAKVPSGP